MIELEVKHASISLSVLTTAHTQSVPVVSLTESKIHFSQGETPLSYRERLLYNSPILAVVAKGSKNSPYFNLLPV